SSPSGASNEVERVIVVSVGRRFCQPRLRYLSAPAQAFVPFHRNVTRRLHDWSQGFTTRRPGCCNKRFCRARSAVRANRHRRRRRALRALSTPPDNARGPLRTDLQEDTKVAPADDGDVSIPYGGGIGIEP